MSIMTDSDGNLHWDGFVSVLLGSIPEHEYEVLKEAADIVEMPIEKYIYTTALMSSIRFLYDQKEESNR